MGVLWKSKLAIPIREGPYWLVAPLSVRNSNKSWSLDKCKRVSQLHKKISCRVSDHTCSGKLHTKHPCWHLKPQCSQRGLWEADQEAHGQHHRHLLTWMIGVFLRGGSGKTITCRAVTQRPLSSSCLHVRPFRSGPYVACTSRFLPRPHRRRFGSLLGSLGPLWRS